MNTFRSQLNRLILIAVLCTGVFGFASAASAFTCTAVAAGGNWSAAATWSGCNSTIPQTGDDVVLNASSGNVVVDTNSNNLSSFDASAYLGTLSGSSNITVAPSTGSTVTKFGGTLTWTGTLNLNPTSTATTTLTSNGETLNAITIAAASGAHVVLADNLTTLSTKTLTLTSGYLHVDGANDNSGLTHSWGAFNSNNSNSRNIKLGASSITITNAGTITWNVTTTSGLTFNAGSSTINIAGTGSSFSTGALTYNNVTISGSQSGGSSVVSSGTTMTVNGTLAWTGGGSQMLLGNGTYIINNLTALGGNTKTDNLAFNSGNTITVNGVLTISGNSSANRLIVRSTTLGSPASLVVNSSIVASNVDFRDITASGTASWNLSAITGNSGDSLGNTGITFTPSQTNYWVGNTGNWSDSTHWASTSGGSGGTGRVPLPQDNVRFDANSITVTGQTVTGDMPRLGTNIDWTGTLNTPQLNFSGNTAPTLYGSLTLVPTMTLSTVGGPTLTFNGRGSSTFKTSGVSLWGFNMAMPGGSLTLQDNLTLNSVFTMSNGTFNANNFNVSTSQLLSTGSGVRTLNMGSGTWTLPGSGSVWNTSGTTNQTLNANTSTIVFAYTGSTGITVAFNGYTYNNIVIAGGPGSFSFSGSSPVIFNRFTVNTPKTIKFAAGGTNTFSQFIAKGTSGNLITLQSTTPGTKYTLVQKSGFVSSDYMSITDSTATGGAQWFAGTNSTLSNSTGWQLLQGPVQRGVIFQNAKIKIQKGKIKFQFR